MSDKNSGELAKTAAAFEPTSFQYLPLNQQSVVGYPVRTTHQPFPLNTLPTPKSSPSPSLFTPYSTPNYPPPQQTHYNSFSHQQSLFGHKHLPPPTQSSGGPYYPPQPIPQQNIQNQYSHTFPQQFQSNHLAKHFSPQGNCAPNAYMHLPTNTPPRLESVGVSFTTTGEDKSQSSSVYVSVNSELDGQFRTVSSEPPPRSSSSHSSWDSKKKSPQLSVGTRDKSRQSSSAPKEIIGKVLLLVKISKVAFAPNARHLNISLSQYLIKVRFKGQARKFDVDDVLLKRHKAVAFKVDSQATVKHNPLIVELHDKKNYNGKAPYASQSIIVEEPKQVRHKTNLRGVAVSVRTQIKADDGGKVGKHDQPQSNPLPRELLSATAASIATTTSASQGTSDSTHSIKSLVSEDTLLHEHNVVVNETPTPPPSGVDTSAFTAGHQPEDSPEEEATDLYPPALQYSADYKDKVTVEKIVESIVEKHSGSVVLSSVRDLQIPLSTPIMELKLGDEASMADVIEQLEASVSEVRRMERGSKSKKLPCLIFLHDTFYTLLKHMCTKLHEYIQKTLRHNMQVYVIGSLPDDISTPALRTALGMLMMQPGTPESASNDVAGDLASAQNRPVKTLGRELVEKTPLLKDPPHADDLLKQHTDWPLFGVEDVDIHTLTAYKVKNRSKSHVECPCLILTDATANVIDVQHSGFILERIEAVNSDCTLRECFEWFSSLLNWVLPNEHWQPWMRFWSDRDYSKKQRIHYLMVPFVEREDKTVAVDLSLVAEPFSFSASVPRENTIKVGSIVGVQRHPYSDIYRVNAVRKYSNLENLDQGLDAFEFKTLGVYANVYRNVCTLLCISPWSKSKDQKIIGIDYHEDVLRHYEIESEDFRNRLDPVLSLLAAHTRSKREHSL